MTKEIRFGILSWKIYGAGRKPNGNLAGHHWISRSAEKTLRPISEYRPDSVYFKKTPSPGQGRGDGGLIVMDKRPHRDDALSGGVSVKRHLSCTEAAGRVDGVAFGLQLHFETLLAGDTGALMPGYDLAVTAFAGNDHNGLSLPTFHASIELWAIEQVVLGDFRLRGHG